jgi:ribosome biogenesis SPOUT family RNA methylase Rps3
MTKEEQTKPAEETQKSITIFIFRGILGRIIKRLRTIRI